VGICLYDPKRKIIGMAHIMLPSSDAVRANANRAKFADTCIPISSTAW
jgi:chemotaxis protein CheD